MEQRGGQAWGNQRINDAPAEPRHPGISGFQPAALAAALGISRKPDARQSLAPTLRENPKSRQSENPAPNSAACRAAT